MYDVVYTLSGDPAAPPSLDSMVERYVHKLKSDLEDSLWHAGFIDEALATRLGLAFETIPESHRYHYLLTPAIFEAISGFRKRATVDRLLRLVELTEDEALLAGAELMSHRSGLRTWSPMGDASLASLEGDGIVTHVDRLDSLIVMDFDSPAARDVRLESSVMCHEPGEFSFEDRSKVTRNLSEAMRYINRISPTFSRLILNYTRAIRLRRCADCQLGSEHITTTIGEIRLLNPQRDEYTPIRLAEALIHESVHNYLSTYEYLNIPFVLSGASPQYRPISTWSGNPIPVAAFCHAVFVWFALFQFSLIELALITSELAGRLPIMRRRNQYAAGFLIPTRLSASLEGYAEFNGDILATIDSLQRSVKEAMPGGAFVRRDVA